MNKTKYYTPDETFSKHKYKLNLLEYHTSVNKIYTKREEFVFIVLFFS